MATLSDFNEFGGPYSNMLASVRNIQKMAAPAIRLTENPAMKALADNARFFDQMNAALSVSQLRLPDSYFNGLQGIAKISADYAQAMKMIRPAQLNVAADAVKAMQRSMASLDVRVLPSLQTLESTAEEVAESEPEKFVSRITSEKVSGTLHEHLDSISDVSNDQTTDSQYIVFSKVELNDYIDNKIQVGVKQVMREVLAEHDAEAAPKHPKLQATAKIGYELFMTVIPNVAWYLQIHGVSVTVIQNLIIALTTLIDPSLGSTFPTHLLA